MKSCEYFETFAPKTKPETFQLLFSLAVKEIFTLRRMDVKSASLPPEYKEEI